MFRSVGLFRIIIVAIALGWAGYKIGSEIWPDRRFTTLDEDILVGSKAEAAHKLVARYRFKLAEFDGVQWLQGGQPIKQASAHFPKNLASVQACEEEACRYFMATKIQAPFVAAGLIKHAYRFFWAEADGEIAKLIVTHDLWRM